mgnify:CR=1 FL=1
MRNERIVFFGTPAFAVGILKMLLDEKYNVVAAVSQPDRPVGRKHKIEKTPVKVLCEEYGIPCLQMDHLKDEVDKVLAYEPDVIVTCAYGQIVPSSILEYPRLGCINVHPSLLPKYRGGAPMHFAILNGDEVTGVSLMEMTKKMDAGKVYAQVELPIGKDETEAELEPRLLEASVTLLKENLPLYLDGKLPGVEQDESKVTFCHNISREMEKVSFQSEEVHTLYNHIRGLIDWPVPYGMVEGKRVKFYAVRMEEKDSGKPAGEILGFKDHAMEVAANGGVIRVLELQMEGKKRMSADAFANGYSAELTGKRFD